MHLFACKLLKNNKIPINVTNKSLRQKLYKIMYNMKLCFYKFYNYYNCQCLIIF